MNEAVVRADGGRRVEFDVVVHGATGFTGALVAEHFARRCADAGLRWALSGRDKTKLERLRAALDLGEETSLIVADSHDPPALEALASRTAIIISTVGPYQLYGEPLVAACTKAGTDYLDLCGETAWMRSMIARYEAQARANGARIFFSCGVDSIPFELGVFFLQQAARERTGSPLRFIKARVKSFQGAFSGGTLASLKANAAAAMSDADVRTLLSDPFCLTPGFRGPVQPEEGGVEFDEDLQSWTAPFVMAAINSRNIHRSNYLQEFAYGQDFTYSERMLTGPGQRGEMTAKAIATGVLPVGDAKAPNPGEGPTRAEREAGSYEVIFTGAHDGGGRLTAYVRGDMDPGYGSTSKMLAETALELLQHEQPRVGGFWTPGAVLGASLIKRLQERAGLEFRLMDL